MRFFAALITIYLITVPFAFAKKKPPSKRLYQSYLKAIISIEKGDFRTGLKDLEKAKKLDPTSFHIRLKKAALHIRLGEMDKAEKELKESKKIDPERMDASLALIFLYSYTQKDDELEDEYEEFLTKAHELKPEEVKISEYLAQFYFYKKRLEDSIKVYEAILEKNPDYLEGVFWLGVLYEEVGRRPDAIEMWKHALKIDDHHGPTLNSLGYVYAEEGIHLNEAEKMVKRALEKEPDNGVYLDSLGWVYFKKKEYKKAEEYLKKAAASTQDPVIFEHLGDVYVVLDKVEEAVGYYERGFLLSPESEELKEKLEKYGPKDQIPEEESN